jgi:sterol desaturase/sphingolipid hydroxylase (fatty acid hydroxylase superfamily)
LFIEFSKISVSETRIANNKKNNKQEITMLNTLSLKSILISGAVALTIAGQAHAYEPARSAECIAPANPVVVGILLAVVLVEYWLTKDTLKAMFKPST